MRILVCSTPRSRSTIMNEYLVKKYGCHNYYEKLNYPHELASSVHPNFLKKKTRHDLFTKRLKDQISEIFEHDSIVCKLWGTMFTYSDFYKPFWNGPITRIFPIDTTTIDYKRLTIISEISSLIPFHKFDKIYYLQRNVYDVASSWVYHVLKANDIEYVFKHQYKLIVSRAVLDVLLLEKIHKYLHSQKIQVTELSFEEIPEYISEFEYKKKPNNINYNQVIANYEQLIECVDQCIYDYKFIENIEFT